VLEAPEVARHVTIREGYADAGVDGKPAVLPGEHVARCIGVDESPPPKPADEPASHALGERRDVGRRGRQGGEQRDAVRRVGGREDAVSDAGVELDVAVESGAEAVEEGDGAEPGLHGWRLVPVARHAGRLAEKSFHLVEEDRGECRDGLGAVGEKHAQPLGHRDHPLPDGYRRDDVVNEVGHGLRHVSPIARWADAAALAGKAD
jgi:hypothetical protein